MLSPDARTMVLDLTRFHDLVATEPTESFPYRASDAMLAPGDRG